jgi:HK97 family phage portal protein
MLTNLFESRATISSSDPAVLELFGASATESGENVTETTALKLSAVYSCFYILSSSIAQLPLHVLRKTKDKNGKEQIARASDHPVFHLLHDEPNQWQTSYEWRESKMHNVLSSGNGFTEIVRRRNGEIIELDHLSPFEVSPPEKGTASNQWLYPVYDADREKNRAIRPENMLHIKALTPNKRWGVSPIRQHAETIGLGLAAQKYGSQFFGSGGRPNGILINKSGGSRGEGQSNLKAAWKEGGIGKGGGKTAVLHGDIAYQAITISPEEAQFLETRKMTRSEIAGIFNVPAHMINDLDKATFSNITQQAIQFVRHTMVPWVVKYEQELNRKLFTTAERRAGYYVKFNLAGLLRGTPKERAEFYHYGITDGWMDRNEARAFEEMNQRDGLDQLLISVQAQHPDQLTPAATQSDTDNENEPEKGTE